MTKLERWVAKLVARLLTIYGSSLKSRYLSKIQIISKGVANII
jgi:hypothetical protein